MKSKAPYKILTYPNEILRDKAKPVKEFNKELITISNNMLFTLLSSGGIGLAGNQVGILQRIIIVLTDHFQGIMINPEIIARSNNSTILAEGCLSFPGQRVNIDRPETIYVSWYNLDGTGTNREFGGITAKCIQHEIDHLNGILIEDHKGENNEL